MRSSIATFGAVLSLGLLLSGCPAHQAYKDGVAHQEAGKDWMAAQDYLHALAYNPNHGKAMMALIDVAPHAYEIQLDRAEEAELGKNWPVALQEYKTLGTFVDAASRFGATINSIDVAAKIDDIENSAAREAYAKAEKAFGEKRWADAIAGWDEALKFKANYRDAAARIGGAHYAWAEQDLAESSWRSAAERFQTAAKNGGKEDANARAAGIYAALGKYFLDKTQCRQAARDFTAASALTRDATVTKNLATAQQCALVPLTMGAIENPTGIANVGGVAVPVVVGEAIQARMTSTGSEFVRVLAPTSAGLKYRIEGRLTQIKLDKPAPVTTKATTPGTLTEKCTQNDANGQPVETTCTRPVTLAYVDHTAKVKVRIVGSSRIVDLTQKNKEIGTRAFDLSLDDNVHWADGFTYGEQPANPADFQVSRAIQDLAGARKELKDEGELTKELAEGIANDVAPYLVGLVDVEAPTTDPTKLTIKALP